MFGRGKKKQYDPTKENFIKSRILDSLAEAIKVIQSENKDLNVSLGLTESTARLCSVLEALFIHGLKSTFLGRFPSWGGGDFSPRLPEPSFWTFALLYSHKQVISSIEKSSQITTEVGKARAWLRLALNDGLLVSYLLTMTRDKSSLSVHYENYAMLRDLERIDLARSYVTGLEIFSLNLPTNVSMFNRWLPEPLSLAGVWESTLEPITDTSCIDALAEVEEIEEADTHSQPHLIRSLAQPIQNNSVVQLGLLNEDEALRLILQSTPVSLPCSPPPPHSAQTYADNRHTTDDALTRNENKNFSNNFNPSMTQGTSTNWTGQVSSSRSPDLVISPAGSNISSRNNSPVRGYRKQRQSKSPFAAGTSRPLSQDLSRCGGETVPDHLNLQTRIQTSPSLSNIGPKKSPSEPLLDIYMKRSPSPTSETQLRKSPSLESELRMRKSPSPEPSFGDTSSSTKETNRFLQNVNEITLKKGEEKGELLNPNSECYTMSRTSSPCRPSATPSMEWDEELPVQREGCHEHDILDGDQPNSLEMELQQAQQLENQQMDKSESSGTSSSDKSCTCSTQGPDPQCLLCSSVELKPAARFQLSADVEPDLSSTDQISLEGERRRRRQSYKIGFRKSPDLSIAELSLQRNLDLVSCLDIIPRELGLHTQDWRCIDCTKAIGALFGNGKVCAFTKKHYCEDCHVDDKLVIPSRLLYNWDAKRYSVARTSFKFLQLARTLPIIKLREFNPKIKDFVPSIDTIMTQRKKLHYMHAYLTACSRAEELDLVDRLLILLAGRDYICTGTEMFSVLDIEEVHSGQMLQALKSGIDLCSKHIDSCLICSGRGFICEICKDKRPVYPYNLDTSSQCSDCFTVFHSTCAKSLIQCPRCERISSRALNSLIAETKLTRELR